VVRNLSSVLVLVAGALLAGSAGADTFKLTDGETLTGEVMQTTATDQGIRIKVGEAQYTNVPWARFSQEDLKNFARNQKMQPFVVPFIEIEPHVRIKKPEVNIKQPPRLERPAPQSLFGALFSSTLGVFVLLVLYAANIFAGYEVAIYRAQPPRLVSGLSAIPLLGLLAPIVFLALPVAFRSSAGTTLEAPAQASAPSPALTDEINPMLAEGAQHPTGLSLAQTGADTRKSDLPETLVYQRGQYTFNRRFIETKFAGFFGVVRRDAERDLVLTIQSARGLYVGQRISRISANDLHLQVQRGHATEEVMIPFQEIQEIRLQHKDA
jgi:hypothetical protein